MLTGFAEAVQLVAPVVFQDKRVEPPEATEVGLAENKTVGGGGVVTVIVVVGFTGFATSRSMVTEAV